MVTPLPQRPTTRAADGSGPAQHPAGHVRLELKSGSSRGGHVDGAWWPRSRDLRAELPDLVAAVDSRLGPTVGPVLRIGFGLRDWDSAGRARLVTPSGRVAFSGYTTFAPDVVWLSSHSTARRPVVLLVVPPETPEDRATAAMHRAASAGNTERPAELLAGHPGTGGPPGHS